jgi:DNA polymerase-3 subunit alpha
LSARGGGQFVSLIDFLRRVDSRRVNKKVLESLVKAGAFDAFGKRAALLAALDDIRMKPFSADSAQAQTSLFGEPENKEEASDKLPDVEDFTLEEKLELEKQLLGFYLTQNPIQEALDKLSGRLSAKICDLSEEYTGHNIKIAGIIEDCRVVLTKNGGKPMAFAKLTDGTASIELVVFPKIYSQTRLIWDSRQPIVIEGRLEYKEETPSVVVEVARHLGDELNLSQQNEYILRIPRHTKPQTLLAINKLLQANQGEDNLTIVVENAFGEKRIKLPYGVSWNLRLQSKIKELLQ